MKRRLVSQGKNALTITIPSAWRKKFELKPGDEVDVEEKGSSLIVNTDKAIGVSDVEINISELDDILIWTYLLAAYRKGYEEIRVKFEKNETIKLLQQVADAMMGMAIVEQRTKSCVIREVSSASQKEFYSMLRRVFFMLKQMAADSYEAVQKGDKETLKNIELQDYNVNKFTNFCLRILSKYGAEQPENTPAIFYIVAELENLGDEYVRLSWDAQESEKPSEDISEVFSEINAMLTTYETAFYKMNKENITALVRAKQSISAVLKDLKVRNEDTRLFYHLSKITHLLLNLSERAVMLVV